MNGGAKKFKLPSVFGQKSNETTPSPMKFNNLSDLANAHLSSTKLSACDTPKMNHSPSISIPQQSNQSKFVIPKFNGGSASPSSGGESLTPHEVSLKKIMDLKRLHISATSDTENTPPDNNKIVTSRMEKQQFPIDLASALNGPNFSKPTIAPTKPVAEQIDFKFIDCDIAEVSNEPLDTQDCCLNISNILEKKFSNRTKSTTAFGKILCSKYKRKKQLLIQHGFVSKHQIKPFRFDVAMKYSK